MTQSLSSEENEIQQHINLEYKPQAENPEEENEENYDEYFDEDYDDDGRYDAWA